MVGVFTFAVCLAAQKSVAPKAGAPSTSKPVSVTPKPGLIVMKFESASNTRKGFWDASTKYPVFESAAPLVKFASSNLGHWARKNLNQFVAESKRDLLPPTGQKPTPGYYAYEAKSEVVMVTDSIVSVLTTTFWDMLGAHPNSFFTEYNFGMVGGKPKLLALKDLFRPGVDALGQVDAVVTPILRSKGSSEAAKADFHLTALLAEQFVIERDGLRFWFSPYDVGYYAQGPFTAKVPWVKLPGLDPKGPLKSLLAP